MRTTSPQTEQAWLSPVKVGEERRPVVRATVQRASLRRVPYNTEDAPGGDYDHEKPRKGTFTTIAFGPGRTLVEIPNIRSISWSRSVDTDVAECTLTILNTDTDPIGAGTADEDYGYPGALTAARNTDQAAIEWPHLGASGWKARIAPDRLVRTYEGYGINRSVWPGDDEHLYQSGTWLIDEVKYAANGDLQLQMRDIGRLLLDQLAFPPVIPRSDYPIRWSTIREDEVERKVPTGGEWKDCIGHASSSNEKYIGAGITTIPRYVGPNGGVQGHQAKHALAGGEGEYWLSTGQGDPSDKVWWQVNLDGSKDLAGLRIKTFGGPYKIFISLYSGTENRWLGKRDIPYEVTTAGIDIGADIPYVDTLHPTRGQTWDHTLARKFRNITKIRLTFTRLRRFAGWKSEDGDFRWRAGLRYVGIYTGPYAELGFGTGTLIRPVGNIRDWSDVVRWACAWGGYFWPARSELNSIQFDPFGDPVHYTYATHDPALPKGRVWGSIQNTGTAPIADLTADNFDKQPLMEMIAHARTVTGFNAFTDECGGFIWRLPNIYAFGNYVSNHHKEERRGQIRTENYITIDEATTLVDYSARTSSRNLRERVGVADAQGRRGAVIAGYQPPGVVTHLRRYALWSDQNFATNKECLVAADMIAARQLMDYRRGKVTIWGNPAIQIDDQIRVIERVTGDTYFHYVAGIQSTLDMEAGTWEYTLETHWLGEEPEIAWLVDATKLDQATQNFLSLLGAPD